MSAPVEASTAADLRGLAVPFPLQQRVVRTRVFPVIDVAHELIERLSVEELHTYLHIGRWYQRGEAADLQRLADEVWAGSLYQANLWIFGLAQHGLILTVDEYRAHLSNLRTAEEREADRRAAAEAKRRERASYTGEEWSGSWPVTSAAAIPAKDQSVVYFAWDKAGDIAYVGSTKHFANRMAQHAEARRSMTWHRWTAKGCPDRQAAYTLERDDIDRLNPPQNHPPKPPSHRVDHISKAKASAQRPTAGGAR